VPKTYTGEGDRDINIDVRVDGARSKTLGGVSREMTASFFPIVSKERGAAPMQNKGKRRWHKRPEGYHTSDEEKTPVPGDGSVVSDRPQEGDGDNEQNGQRIEVELESETDV
jgi:hypothetical protein